jgi:hypothetical protein
MKKLILAAIGAILLFAFNVPAFADASAADPGGKWELTRTNEAGHELLQSVELKDGKFTFRVTTTAGEKRTYFFARGEYKLQTLDSLTVLSFSKVEAGANEDEIRPSDDVRQCVYVLTPETLTFAVDFDKNRGKLPRIEVYHRVKA